MSVLLVDWLGRGGIAQTSAAWAAHLREAGHPVVVVTRPGRELPTDLPAGAGSHSNPVVAHRHLARQAASAIADLRPETVVVQSFVLPILEGCVHRAARAAGARTIVVVHDHRPPSLLGGNRLGLRRQLQSADVVVAHTRYVAERVEHFARRPVELVDLPVPGVVLDAIRPPTVFGPSERPTALHFGVLKRRYKGGAVAVELARSTPTWRFAFLGTGAPRPAEVPEGVVRAGYVPNGDLARAVEESDVALLPYRAATQSAAVVLAQALGTVPVACAVGGIPEQIVDGVSGRLISAGASTAAWRQLLEDLTDPSHRRDLVAGGRLQVAAAQERFVASVDRLVA